MTQGKEMSKSQKLVNNVEIEIAKLTFTHLNPPTSELWFSAKKLRESLTNCKKKHPGSNFCSLPLA
jgi:hypothetical protein